MDQIQFVASLCFAACLALVFYTYLGYPLLIWSLSGIFARRVVPPATDERDLPSVSLLIAAYNEEAVIEERLENALRMDYPRDKLEIVISSDGSTDRTTEIVRYYADRNARLLDYACRRGKATVLNASIPELKGEIILFSDANTQIEAGALRKLVRWFEDPGVGVVCGEMILVDPHTGKNAESLYWKLEAFLKRCEGRLGALLGANGGIYALRRNCYTRIPDATVLDDLVIPLVAKLRTGCAILYDIEAVAWEETPPELLSEFRRRTRLGAGGYQSIGILCGLLDPRQGWTAFAFVSHKILRWLCPFFLLGLLASNLVLCARPFFQAMLLAQVGFYVLSWIMSVIPGRFGFLKPLRLTAMFTGINLAFLIGFRNWLRGTQQGVWQRTVRASEEADGVVR
jgi:cellulose synthase/poly-beta-1,6-N-acetylglucosamine synthase-like glycosyltransferase